MNTHCDIAGTAALSLTTDPALPDLEDKLALLKTAKGVQGGADPACPHPSPRRPQVPHRPAR